MQKLSIRQIRPTHFRRFAKPLGAAVVNPLIKRGTLLPEYYFNIIGRAQE